MFGLLGGNFQALASSDPLDPLVAHQSAGVARQICDLAITVAAELTDEFDDIGCQPFFIITARGTLQFVSSDALRRNEQSLRFEVWVFGKNQLRC